MKWFNDVFLASIFEKIGINNAKWLTVKQTAICVQNMELHTVRIEDKWLGYCNHNNYEYIWRGRRVTMSYSKKNGCGTIIFEMNKDEAQKAHEAYQKEKAEEELERIKRCFIKHPDKYTKKIEKIKADIAYWEDDLQECIANGEDTAETLRCLEESKQELKVWESVRDS